MATPTRKLKPPARKPRVLTVEAAVKRDLAAIGRRDKALAQSSLAASALALGREIDSVSNSATSKSMCAKALLDTMDRLRELAPAEVQEDTIDELRRRTALKLVAS